MEIVTLEIIERLLEQEKVIQEIGAAFAHNCLLTKHVITSNECLAFFSRYSFYDRARKSNPLQHIKQQAAVETNRSVRKQINETVSLNAPSIFEIYYFLNGSTVTGQQYANLFDQFNDDLKKKKFRIWPRRKFSFTKVMQKSVCAYQFSELTLSLGIAFEKVALNLFV